MTKYIKKDKNLYKILGPKSSLLVNKLTQLGKSVFTFNEVLNILNFNHQQVKKLLYNLTKRGWIKRIERGKYFLIPLGVDINQPYTENQFLIASKLIEPYYIGFWTMLNYYGYTEQLPNTIFIVSPKRKNDISLLGVNYKFIKIPIKKMFGLTEIKITNTTIVVSDKEKTLVDCLEHPQYCGGIIEVVKAIWNAKNEVNFNKILENIRGINNSTVAKRLGYILEIMNIQEAVDLKILQALVRRGYSLLDPLSPATGRYNSKWNILLNIDEEKLLSFRRA